MGLTLRKETSISKQNMSLFANLMVDARNRFFVGRKWMSFLWPPSSVPPRNTRARRKSQATQKSSKLLVAAENFLSAVTNKSIELEFVCCVSFVALSYLLPQWKNDSCVSLRN